MLQPTEHSSRTPSHTAPTITLEQALHALVDAHGGKTCQLPGEAGEWLVQLPGGVAGFLVLCAPGAAPTDVQRAALEKHRALGFVAGWADGLEGVQELLARLQAPVFVTPFTGED